MHAPLVRSGALPFSSHMKRGNRVLCHGSPFWFLAPAYPAPAPVGRGYQEAECPA